MTPHMMCGVSARTIDIAIIPNHSTYSVMFSFLWQDLLKDFLEKKDKGELMIQKTSNLLKTILKEVPTTGFYVMTIYAAWSFPSDKLINYICMKAYGYPWLTLCV